MSKTTSTLLFFASLIVFASVLSLALVTYSLYQRVVRIEEKPTGVGVKIVEVGGESQEVDLAGLIEDEVARQLAALPTSAPVSSGREYLAPTTTPVSTSTPVVQQKSTSFIPLDGTKTTTNTGWETIEDSAAWIDLQNDYGSGAVVTWSASLKIAHGNGQMFARIWDDTNKIAVDGSEISTKNNVAYETVVSGNLPLWKGKNLYKVQVKSLNGFEGTFSGGKMKVSY